MPFNWYSNNGMVCGLEWIFSKLCTTCNFMDLTISIRDSKFHTTLFEKEQNIYLYLPPHSSSSHPKGVITGLAMGKILRIHCLCSDTPDADARIQEFLRQLLARGHTRDSLAHLFHRAEANALTYISRSPADHQALQQSKLEDAHSQLYFHLQYHPEDPQSRVIQELWWEYVSHPAGELPSAQMKNLLTAV